MDSYIQIAPDGTGKKVDNSLLETTSGAVYRQRISIGDDTEPSNMLVIDADGKITSKVEATILPLPTGASTETTLAGVLTNLQSILTELQSTLTISGIVTADTGLNQPLTDTQLRAADVKVSLDSEQIAISNFPATQPISGTVTANTGLSQPLTDAQLRATPVSVSGSFYQATQPISASALPLPSGAATSAKQDSIIAALGAPFQVGGSIGNTQFGATQFGEWEVDVGNLLTDGIVSCCDDSVPFQPAPPRRWKWSFADVMSGIDTTRATLIKTGAGMAVNQTGGNLVITTGTTAYSETIIRSLETVSEEFVLKWKTTLSQRIANNNFVVELVDIIGDGLDFTVNSTTSITVIKSAHGYTAADVGKGMWIGASSLAGCLTQRAVIASIGDVDTFNLTVAGFPASGTGTCSLFGMNYHQIMYNGTSATALGSGYQTQRHGWATAYAAATINTTATGHIGIIESTRSNDSSFLDQVYVTGAGVQSATRASSNENIPDEGTPLYLQIRTFNGSTAPASTTTWTIGFVYFSEFNPLYVNLSGVNPVGAKNGVPVTLTSSTVTLSSSAVTATTTLSSAAPAVYADTTTNLGESATYTGTSRDAGSTNTMRYFAAVFYSSHTGTAKIQHSIDATNWYDVAVAAVTAATPVSLRVDVMARYHRVMLINDATATTTLMIRSAYHRV